MSLMRQSLIYFAIMIVWSVFCGLVAMPPAIHFSVQGLVVGWYLFTPTRPTTPTKQDQGEAA